MLRKALCLLVEATVRKTDTKGTNDDFDIGCFHTGRMLMKDVIGEVRFCEAKHPTKGASKTLSTIV